MTYLRLSAEAAKEIATLTQSGPVCVLAFGIRATACSHLASVLVLGTPFTGANADEPNGNARRKRERQAIEAKRDGYEADQEDENERGENHVHPFRLALTVRSIK
jgi:hypothetical protein